MADAAGPMVKVKVKSIEKAVAANAASAMDWPLSRDEKKRQLLHVLEQDAKISDSMLSSGEAALTKLKSELEAIKSTSGGCQVEGRRSSQDVEQRLFQAVEAAAAVLRAVVPSNNADDPSFDGDECLSSGIIRSRSEPRTLSGTPIKPALCRTPLGSLGGRKRRVSFGDASPGSFRSTSDVGVDEPGEPEPEESLPPAERRDADDPISPHAHSAGTSDIESPASGKCSPSNNSGSNGLRNLSRTQSHTSSRSSGGTSDTGPVSMEWGLAEFCVPVGMEKVGIHFKNFPPERLLVRRITQGSWAATAGINVGDVIIAVGGRHAEVLSPQQFMVLMQSRPLRLIVDRKSRHS